MVVYHITEDNKIEYDRDQTKKYKYVVDITYHSVIVSLIVNETSYVIRNLPSKNEVRLFTRNRYASMILTHLLNDSMKQELIDCLIELKDNTDLLIEYCDKLVWYISMIKPYIDNIHKELSNIDNIEFE